MLGALGASGAVCFTNPLEVIKTRFQLQGELKKVGNYKVHYRNFAHAIYVVAKNEGPLALQKGLLPAMGHQVFLNGTRLGIFDLAQKNGWLLKSDGTVSLTKSVIVGAAAGTLGGFLASPLGMVSVVGLGVACVYRIRVRRIRTVCEKPRARHRSLTLVREFVISNNPGRSNWLS